MPRVTYIQDKSQTTPRKYCNPTKGSCTDHLHKERLGRSLGNTRVGYKSIGGCTGKRGRLKK